jgi:hypothetical protein
MYPDALSEEGANISKVAPGAAFRNLRFVSKTVPICTVNGKIDGASSGAAGQRYIVMISGGLTFLAGRNIRESHFVVGVDGTFRIRELQAGHYML